LKGDRGMTEAVRLDSSNPSLVADPFAVYKAMHDYHAGLVAPFLQPRRLRGLTDPIRQIARSLCDANQPREIDFVNQFARGPG
jgi:cytochrome P450